MEYEFKGQSFTEIELEQNLKSISGDNYNPEMLTIIKCGLNNPDLLPKLKNKKSEITDLVEYLTKWSEKYFSGFNSRASVKVGNPSGTIPDTLVSYIFNERNKNLTPEKVEFATYSHSNMMTIENIVGELLEEFLSIELKELHWFCCWGSTIKAVDFCNIDGRLLQVKTSDNSENSSSSGVRTGTTILKWARRKSKKKDEYYWDDLVQMTGKATLNEDNFRKFVSTTLANNPNCIYIVE